MKLKFTTFVKVIVIYEFFYVRSVVSAVLVHMVPSTVITELALSCTAYSHIPLAKTLLFDCM